MRFMPERGHHVLRTLLRKGVVRPRLDQEGLYPRGEVSKHFGKGLLILVLRDGGHTGHPMRLCLFHCRHGRVTPFLLTHKKMAGTIPTGRQLAVQRGRSRTA